MEKSMYKIPLWKNIYDKDNATDYSLMLTNRVTLPEYVFCLTLSITSLTTDRFMAQLSAKAWLTDTCFKYVLEGNHTIEFHCLEDLADINLFQGPGQSVTFSNGTHAFIDHGFDCTRYKIGVSKVFLVDLLY